jgi:hypothetical protein
MHDHDPPLVPDLMVELLAVFQERRIRVATAAPPASEGAVRSVTTVTTVIVDLVPRARVPAVLPTRGVTPSDQPVMSVLNDARWIDSQARRLEGAAAPRAIGRATGQMNVAHLEHLANTLLKSSNARRPIPTARRKAGVA